MACGLILLDDQWSTINRRRTQKKLLTSLNVEWLCLSQSWSAINDPSLVDKVQYSTCRVPERRTACGLILVDDQWSVINRMWMKHFQRPWTQNCWWFNPAVAAQGFLYNRPYNPAWLSAPQPLSEGEGVQRMQLWRVWFNDAYVEKVQLSFSMMINTEYVQNK